jgi:zinc transport system substrate-binding protein
MRRLLGLVVLMLPALAAARLPVIVSVAPYADLVQRLGGDLVTVQVLVAPGQSSHTYDPTPRELGALAGGRVWLRAGLPLEDSLAGRLAKLAPQLRAADLTAGLELLPAADEHAGHDHAEENDTHIWLSARLAAHQAATAADAMCAADPAHAADYRANLAALQDSLAAIDRELTTLLAPVRGRAFYVFHPSFAYFARDYGLRQVAIETGGLEPSPRHLAHVLDDAKSSGATTIFLQPQYAAQAARTVAAEAGLQVGTLDGLAPDLLANLRRIGYALRRALESATP